MPRWEPDGLERLQLAAFELFAEQGFERTTVAEIAQRAGLTQRTFFNHFADKREVLFSLSEEYQQEVVRAIAACPDELPPLDAVVSALQVAAGSMFEHRRAAAKRRYDIIEANPELQERELSKRAALVEAIAGALRARDVDHETAVLTASASMLVQQTAMQRWTRQAESRPLAELLAEALQALRATIGQGVSTTG